MTSHQLHGKTKRYGPLIALLIGLMVIALLWYFYGGGGGRGGGGGGGGGSPTQTQTSTPGVVVEAPVSDIPNAYTGIIVLEDHVQTGTGGYYITATVFGSYRSIVSWGGSSVSGNITAGVGYVDVGNYRLILFGVASTNSTVQFEDSSIKYYLTSTGGYILYKPASAAVYVRPLVFNVSNTKVYVWVPTNTQTATPSGVQYHITVDPQNGVAYVNGNFMPVGLTALDSKWLKKGVNIGWAVTASASGTYKIQINP